MTGPVIVQVHSRDQRLRHALSRRLQKLEGLDVADPSAFMDVEALEAPGNGRSGILVVLIATSPDIPAPLCAQLAERGVLVIMLAPVIREKERLAYLAAGAYSYLEMDVNNKVLLEQIAAIAQAHGTGDTAQPATASLPGESPAPPVFRGRAC